MTKSQLIKLIHVAKSQLNIDDETYRQFLVKETSKDSTKKMLKHELEKVNDVLKQKGFKYQVKKANKPTVSIAKRRDDIQKIRAIWITMGKQRFIDDSSDKALDAYVERMTKSKMTLNGIKVTAWLTEELACYVLECLKMWHLRCIRDRFKPVHIAVFKGRSLFINGECYRGYDAISSFYQEVIRAQQTRGGR